MLYSCILFYSLLNGIDPELTRTIIRIESNGNPMAIGRVGDSGLMQIRHQFVPETQLQLFVPCTNVSRGVQILKKAKEKCSHQTNDQWIICYNKGISGGNRIRFPDKDKYWLKFKTRKLQ